MSYEMVKNGVSYEKFRDDILRKQYRIEYWKKHGELPTVKVSEMNTK